MSSRRRRVGRHPVLSCNGLFAVVCEGLIDYRTGEWVVGFCWRCKASSSAPNGCEAIGARLPLANSSGIPQGHPKIVPQKDRKRASEAYEVAEDFHINRVLQAKKRKIEASHYTNIFGRKLPTFWKRMSPFLEVDDTYVNWPVAHGDLPQARKSTAPKPTNDTSAASVAQLEAREGSLCPSMRRCIRLGVFATNKGARGMYMNPGRYHPYCPPKSPTRVGVTHFNHREGTLFKGGDTAGPSTEPGLSTPKRRQLRRFLGHEF